MRSFLIFWYLFFITPFLISQNHIVVQAYDEDSGDAVSFAVIHNRMMEVSIICDNNGWGIVPIKDSTLLKISAVSYQDYYHFITFYEEKDTLKIALKHRTYDLKELVVHPYPTRILFKKAIANIELPDTNFISPHLFFIPNLKGLAEQSKAYEQGNLVSISLGSPITGIYNMLNRKERSKRKLQKLEWNDAKSAFIQKRYNEEYVYRLLGIKKMKQIEAFMEFCQPDYEFLLACSDYELACYVLNCYQSFLLNQEE